MDLFQNNATLQPDEHVGLPISAFDYATQTLVKGRVDAAVIVEQLDVSAEW